MSPDERDGEGPDGRKAVLVCPDCDREAPMDGAWSLEHADGRDAGRTDVRCPDCGRVVVSQPQFAPSMDGVRSASVASPVLQLVDSVVRHHVL